MDLKDLAEVAAVSTPPSRSVKEKRRWCLIHSRLLDERVLLLFEIRHLKEARRQHPDVVVYFPVEIEELRRFRNEPDHVDIMKGVHLVKKQLRGWVWSEDSSVIEKMDARRNLVRGVDP